MLLSQLFESSLSSYLSSLRNIDQRKRNNYAAFVKANGNDYETGAKFYAQRFHRPPDDIFGEKQRCKEFIQKSKTFQFDEFNETDWDNFWMITQHCDFDRTFQQWALEIIKEHLGIENDHYKYLYDRISCALHGTQKYGTQNMCGTN